MTGLMGSAARSAGSAYGGNKLTQSINAAIGSLSRPGSPLTTKVRLRGDGSHHVAGSASLGGHGVSPDNTVVTTAGQTILTKRGDAWSITLDRRIAVNGLVDGSTRNVIKIAYEGGLVWQLNTAGDWYSKAWVGDPWAGPTKASPIPVGISQISGTGRSGDGGFPSLSSNGPVRQHQFDPLAFSAGFDT